LIRKGSEDFAISSVIYCISKAFNLLVCLLLWFSLDWSRGDYKYSKATFGIRSCSLNSYCKLVICLYSQSEDNNEDDPNNTNYDACDHQVSGIVSHTCGTNHISFSCQFPGLQLDNKRKIIPFSGLGSKTSNIFWNYIKDLCQSLLQYIMFWYSYDFLE
jgi:hypothetical protein